LPVVAITAYNRPEDRERAAAAGFDAHVAKPFHPTQLLDLLGAIVRRAI
jgi:CheY-like chemotaxis protein